MRRIGLLLTASALALAPAGEAADEPSTNARNNTSARSDSWRSASAPAT
jgi:hypothetical protein